VKPAPAPRGTRPIFFYGGSTTQGGCANTTGSDYVSQTGRLLDTEVVNFGFSGNGKGEPEMARLIREVDAELFVLDFLGNADVDTLPAVLTEFIRLLREKRPATPIVVMSGQGYNHNLWDATKRANRDRKRDIAMRVYLTLKEAGDANVHFIDGLTLLPPGISGAYVDGIHPTNHGFSLIAERLALLLNAIRMRPTGEKLRRSAGRKAGRVQD
jgi:lysophospholipase L1-like esterase